MDTAPWYDETAIPALLRAARIRYRTQVRSALSAAGYEDMPANGSYMLGAIARTGAGLSEIIGELGVSKQSAGQLVDTLVMRGYLDRAVDPDDRRRLTITLTERGEAAAGVVRSSVEEVDQDLLARVGPACVADARRALGALVDAQHEHDHGHHHHD